MPPVGLRSRKAAIGEALAERAQQLDLGVGQLDEHRPDAVLDLVDGGRDAGAEHVPVGFCCGLQVGDGDGHVVEPADHQVGSGLRVLERLERLGAQPHDLHLDERPAIPAQIERLADTGSDGLLDPCVAEHGLVVQPLDGGGDGRLQRVLDALEPLDLDDAERGRPGQASRVPSSSSTSVTKTLP